MFQANKQFPFPVHIWFRIHTRKKELNITTPIALGSGYRLQSADYLCFHYINLTEKNANETNEEKAYAHSTQHTSKYTIVYEREAGIKQQNVRCSKQKY